MAVIPVDLHPSAVVVDPQMGHGMDRTAQEVDHSVVVTMVKAVRPPTSQDVPHRHHLSEGDDNLVQDLLTHDHDQSLLSVEVDIINKPRQTVCSMANR